MRLLCRRECLLEKREPRVDDVVRCLLGCRKTQDETAGALTLHAQLPAPRAGAVVRATVDSCLSQMSPAICALVQTRASEGWTVVLATAAPAVYAEAIAAELNYAACLASPNPTRPQDELIGERKAIAVRAWTEELRAGKSVPLLVVTDHLDDLPLLALSDAFALQCSASTKELIEDRLGRTAAHFFDPLEGQSDGGLWLWFDDRPSGPHDVWETTTILSKHRYALLYTGVGAWRRVPPGSPLSRGAHRTSCPSPPSPRQRVAIMLRRRLVRDRLGVFH